ncbi:uncharacterized protein F5Z01DRAFT_138670 [Emericellopsis atlantica]|uniref:Phthiocerol/phthiodiolone dimycocerosyl transferase C-terminal domain-containing protein n=1 Tax=Emericellopsis atlantica TaxID=2614577 RepID=A0A9P7ZJS5_9HYPO|nr:uncharacterized protein F5Z01DRAFT_138670 [Emericellopsis atlantica]KAG9253418.1 hypothetical protein F5Z01DRAFT_138670 [Emericellopsis atlantica]
MLSKPSSSLTRSVIQGKLEQISAACHHLGYFNNVGVSAHYQLSSSKPGSLTSLTTRDLRHLIYTATRETVRKHRILSAIPVDEGSPETYFGGLPSIDLARTIAFHRRSQAVADGGEGEDRELDEVLQDQHNTNFKADEGELPFWRLVILHNPEDTKAFTVSFIYHHAIGDGVAGVAFHDTFRQSLNAAAIEAEVTSVITVPHRDATLPPPLEEVHPLPLNSTAAAPPTASELTEWMGSAISTPCRTHWQSLYVAPDASKAFFQACKEKGLSVTSALSSALAHAVFDVLPTTQEALTCIIPVDLRPWLQLPRGTSTAAMGTYFDAMRVRFTRAESTTDAWAGAHNVAETLRAYRNNVSPSGEPYTAVAAFQGIPDVGVVFESLRGKPRDAALEVTNIGVFPSVSSENGEADGGVWKVGKVLLSRSAVVSGAAVTISVATGGNGSMTVGFSWQDGVVESDLVKEVRERVRRFLSM